MPIQRADVLAQRQQIREIATKHGAEHPRLFGSVARDEATIVSDIDILVTMTMRRSSWFPIGLQRDLEELLHVPVQVVTDRTAFAWTVEKDAIPL
ncbi:MAG: nucleotidyltransferase domain-containing protein [Chloroflexota bacterium]|nr:nucleotidyltransferase domain-containing protein [Chloroflexota bacterium]